MRESIGHGIPYEFDLVFEQHSPDTSEIHWLPLEKADWRYYVIGSQEKGGTVLFNLRLASCLSTKELRSDITFQPNGYGLSSSAVFSYFHNLRFGATGSEVFEGEHLTEISSIYQEIKHIEPSFPEIKRAVTLFLSLDSLPDYSEFTTLGLFSVIEAIITHRPKSTETGDSLTHQVRTKIPLLARRFKTPIKYSDYFCEASEDVLWSKLYDFRSCLAHGDKPDFKGKLSVLKSRIPVHEFLRVVTKTLLRHALQEPELYTDLRKC